MNDHATPARLLLLHHDVLAADTPADDGTTPPTRPEASFCYDLRALPCRIGRGAACEVRIRAQRTDISREHAVIERSGTAYILRDTSRHGTYVNGRRINNACRLDSGDTIGLASGDEMLRFFDPAQAPAALTEREREILHLLAAGLQKKQIALRLAISLNTINTHVKSIYGKLGVGSAIEAANQARKLGLIS